MYSHVVDSSQTLFVLLTDSILDTYGMSYSLAPNGPDAARQNIYVYCVYLKLLPSFERADPRKKEALGRFTVQTRNPE
jgi:hypothetical protein